MLTLTTEEAGEHNLSSDTICNQTSMTFMCGEMIFFGGNCKTILCVLFLPANSYANARARPVNILLFRKCSRGVRLGKNIKIIKTFHLAVELKSSMIMIEAVVNSSM